MLLLDFYTGKHVQVCLKKKGGKSNRYNTKGQQEVKVSVLTSEQTETDGGGVCG